MSNIDGEAIGEYLQKDSVDIEDLDIESEIETLVTEEEGRQMCMTGHRTIYIELFDENFVEGGGQD